MLEQCEQISRLRLPSYSDSKQLLQLFRVSLPSQSTNLDYQYQPTHERRKYIAPQDGS